MRISPCLDAEIISLLHRSRCWVLRIGYKDATYPNDASAAEGLEVMHHATILLPQLINSSFFSSIFFVIAAMILSFSFAGATSLCFILCERQPLQSLQGEFNGFDAD